MVNLPIRVGTDERVRVRQFSSVSNIVGFSLRMTKDREGEELLKPVTFSAEDTVADRTPQDTAVDVPTGWVQDGTFFQRTPGVKRGQAYVDISLFHFNIPTQRLFTGYLYEGIAFPLGHAVEPGPGGGEGHYRWRAIADDIAPADVTHVLAATNAYRRIYGVVWYYHSSGDVAARVLRALLRAPGPSVPTGFSIGETVVNLHSANVTLTANEEGILFSYKSRGGNGISSRNDNGTLAIEDPNALPQIWPIDVEETDLWEIFFNQTDAEAADRHSIFILEEEWIVV